uniref:Uncharacterized protein n=1 Tax=Anopheles minimus TaxID=112268 RepID=A0A182W5P0_9DIPT
MKIWISTIVSHMGLDEGTCQKETVERSESLLWSPSRLNLPESLQKFQQAFANFTSLDGFQQPELWF